MNVRLKWVSLAAIALVFAGLYLRTLEAPPAEAFVPPPSGARAA